MRGIDSMSEAEKYVGAELRIRRNELLPAPDGSFYTFDLRGCSVFSNGECIGLITDVLDLGGPQILKVERDEQETLIPFAQSYLVKVDLEQRRIDVILPEGLRDLNKQS
jgi:16S rRNA processing protein RimM